LGSTVGLTDASQVLRQGYGYEAYGEVAATGSSDNPYQYTGRENDGTGLYYYRARYYSPTLKRFISEDPMGLAAGLDQYAYVHDAPLNRVDPLGLDDTQCMFDPASCGMPAGPRPFMVLVQSYICANGGDMDRAAWQSHNEKNTPLAGFSDYDQTAAEHYFIAYKGTAENPWAAPLWMVGSFGYTGTKAADRLLPPPFPLIHGGKPSADEAQSGAFGAWDALFGTAPKCGCE